MVNQLTSDCTDAFFNSVGLLWMLPAFRKVRTMLLSGININIKERIRWTQRQDLLAIIPTQQRMLLFPSSRSRCGKLQLKLLIATSFSRSFLRGSCSESFLSFLAILNKDKKLWREKLAGGLSKVSFGDRKMEDFQCY